MSNRPGAYLDSDEPIKVGFTALGCAKNLVDSEKMLGQLAEAGVVITADPSEADVLVINTCGFLAAARDEAHEAIREALAQKKQGRCRRVVVAGCLVQRDGTRIIEDIPGVDALVGVHRRDDLVRAVLGSQASSSPPGLYLGKYHPYVAVDTARLRLTPRHYSYLRISEGCNQKCTFCTIPQIRGRMHCKPPKIVLDEARELIGDGVVELNLIGQDTTSYGHDIDYPAGLAGLLKKLDLLDGVRWIRLLYAYPTVFTDEMIAAIADADRVVNYIDIPLQHINDRVLRVMGRGVTRSETERLLSTLRQQIPGVAIRTTLIAGFPGESEAEFQELLAFVQEQRFEALGVFPYSQELDTPAGRLPDQLPEELKQERTDAIMQAQQEIAFAHAADAQGKKLTVLIDHVLDKDHYQARHAGQAPEVDSVTIVRGKNLHPGQMIDVRVDGARGYDLLATAIKPS